MPTLLQVFGPPCYSKLILLLNFFAFYRCLSYTREFIGFALFLYKITHLCLHRSVAMRMRPALHRMHCYRFVITVCWYRCHRQIIHPLLPLNVDLPATVCCYNTNKVKNRDFFKLLPAISAAHAGYAIVRV